MKNSIMHDESPYDYFPIAHIDEIKTGERLILDIGDLSIIVLNIGNAYFAVGNICPHDLGELGEGRLEDFELICPRHGARFDVRDGKVLRLPATVGIPSYPLRIEQDNILIGLPREKSLC
jgi:3-phenylpropionate/trans-cinnamate dioxygenase ferredoxin component